MSVAIVDAMDAMEMAHRAHYKGKVDQLVPFCALINADGSIHTIMNMPMANDDEKDAGVMALVLAMATTGCFGYIFNSEGWMKIVEGEDARNGKLGVMPRDSESRKEVLIMEGHTYKEDSMRMFEIERDWTTGEVTNLRRMEDMEAGVQMQSRFNIFPPRAKKDDQPESTVKH